jgi:hypothetical protein
VTALAASEPRPDLERRGGELVVTSSRDLRQDDRSHLVGLVSVMQRELEEFIYTGYNRTSLWAADDPYASSSSEVHEPLIAQDMQSSYDGVLVYAQDVGEIHSRWHPFTRSDLSIRD